MDSKIKTGNALDLDRFPKKGLHHKYQTESLHMLDKKNSKTEIQHIELIPVISRYGNHKL